MRRRRLGATPTAEGRRAYYYYIIIILTYDTRRQCHILINILMSGRFDFNVNFLIEFSRFYTI